MDKLWKGILKTFVVLLGVCLAADLLACTPLLFHVYGGTLRRIGTVSVILSLIAAIAFSMVWETRRRWVWELMVSRYGKNCCKADSLGGMPKHKPDETPEQKEGKP